MAEEEQDARGWWQRPEERSLQAYTAEPLQAWQVERLEIAYAMGRRKANVQELARDLDVDRSVVIGWFKEFSLKPDGERNTIITARKAHAAEQRANDTLPAAVEPASPEVPTLPAAAAAKLQEQNGPQSTGFIPFYLRKQLGVDKQKRISGSALRTLESVYDRTPFPSADVIKGLYELHRVQKDVALEWFAARREVDGITSSTQKRVGRTKREQDRNFEAAFNDEPSALDAEADAAQRSVQQRRRSASEPSGDAVLLSLMGGAAGAGPVAPKEAEPVVVMMSKREMAALRSSMPSPTKFKGRQMAETMGIKTGADEAVTQIGNVQFVLDTTNALGKMRRSWRYKASQQQANTRKLRLKPPTTDQQADHADST